MGDLIGLKSKARQLYLFRATIYIEILHDWSVFQVSPTAGDNPAEKCSSFQRSPVVLNFQVAYERMKLRI